MPRPIARLTAVIVLALSVVVAVAATASAVVQPTGRYAYWTGYQGSTIQRADVSGGGSVETIWSMFNTTPTGVAVDRSTGDIYWSTRNTVDIYTSEADGSNAHTLNIGSAVANSTLGIAVDASEGRVYWANSDGTIYWAATDGSGTSGQLSTGAAPISIPWGLAIDIIAGKIYWANSDSPGAHADGGWAKLDNSDTGGPLGGAGGGFNVGMAFVPGLNSVFWTEYFTTSVVRTSLDGSSQSNLPAVGSTLDGVAGIGYDAATNTLYVANYIGQSITYMNADDGVGGTLASGLTDVPYGQIAVSGQGHLTNTSGPPTLTAPIGGSTNGDYQFTNDGDYPVVIGTPRMTGGAGFVKGAGCEGLQLDIGGVCTISVTFTPTVGGTSAGVLELPTDSGVFKLTVNGEGQSGTQKGDDPLISGVKAVNRCASSSDAGKLSAVLTSATPTTTTASIQQTSTQRKQIPRACPERAAGTGFVGRVIGNARSAVFPAAAGTQTKTVKQLFGVKSLKPGRYRLAFKYTDHTGKTATRSTSFWVLRK